MAIFEMQSYLYLVLSRSDRNNSSVSFFLTQGL